MRIAAVAFLLLACPAVARAQPPRPPARPAARPSARPSAPPAARPPALTPAQVPAPAPRPPGDQRLARRFSVEVRSAPLADVAEQLGEALEVNLAVPAPLGDQRVNVRAPESSLEEFMRAAQALTGARWELSTVTSPPGYRLNGAEIGAASAAMLQQRRSQFLKRLQEIAVAIARPSPDKYSADLRRQLATNRRDLPDSAIDQITTEYLRQTLLLAPLRGPLQERLAQSGFITVPLRQLTPGQQQMLGQFVARTYARQAGSLAAANDPSAALAQASAVLNAPQARLEYRLIYGDAWSDLLLVVRVGYPDRWSTATLSGALAPLADGRELYPQLERSPEGDDLLRRLTAPVNLAGLTADQAIEAVGAAGKLKVVSDSYARPGVFRPAPEIETLTGLTVREALDVVADAYGYFWWKQDGWILMRHRLWPEEGRVAVSDRVLKSMGASAQQARRLDQEALETLGSMGDEQLLSLNLMGHARGKAIAPLSAMELNELDLVQRSLDFALSLTAAHRNMAAGEGLPLSYLTPAQQGDFAALAADYGHALDRFQIDSYFFKMVHSFTPAGSSREFSDGMLVMQLGFGPGNTRSATLALRLPPPQPPAAGPAAPAGTAPPGP